MNIEKLRDYSERVNDALTARNEAREERFNNMWKGEVGIEELIEMALQDSRVALSMIKELATILAEEEITR